MVTADSVKSKLQKLIEKANAVTGKNATDLTSAINVLIGGYSVKLVITKQPEDVTAVDGDDVTFSVEAEGTGLTYQWELKVNSGSNWVIVSSGGNGPSLLVGATTARSGRQFRCVITDSNGNSITSNAATLTVVAATNENYQ